MSEAAHLRSCTQIRRYCVSNLDAHSVTGLDTAVIVSGLIACICGEKVSDSSWTAQQLPVQAMTPSYMIMSTAFCKGTKAVVSLYKSRTA